VDVNQTLPIDAQIAGELAERLHAMAQPLTILRGAAGALQLSSGLAGSDRRYIDMCSAQAERLCVMLAELRNRLDAAQSEGAGLGTQPDGHITSDCLNASV
jgi:hypothetical protein